MKECNRKHESHQRRDAAAGLPPRPGLPCTTHRADSIPFTLSLFTPFPLPIKEHFEISLTI